MEALLPFHNTAIPMLNWLLKGLAEVNKHKPYSKFNIRIAIYPNEVKLPFGKNNYLQHNISFFLGIILINLNNVIKTSKVFKFKFYFYSSVVLKIKKMKEKFNKEANNK